MIGFQKFSAAAAVLVVSTLISRGVLGGEPLRYRWEANQKFGYEVTVEVDLSDKIDTHKGFVLYAVKSIDGDTIQMSFEGGLETSSKKKASNEPTKPSSHSSSIFQGLARTNCDLIVNRRGQVIRLSKESQLPYMLGNLSLLVFETVGDTDSSGWTIQGGVGLTEKRESNDRFGPGFGPRPFFGPPGSSTTETGKTSAANVKETFKLKSDNEGKAIFSKQYSMTSSGEDEINVEGTGTWTFSRAIGLSETLDFSQQISVAKGNVNVKIPLKISYRLLTSQERDKVEADRAEAARLLKEQHEKFWADKKQKDDEKRKLAEAPLTKEETTAALASLAPNAPAADLEATLTKLSKKRVPDSDPALVNAIRPHLKHPEQKLRRAAEDAMAAWNADYKRRYDVFVKYRDRHRSWEGSGRKVDAKTPLVVGQIVLAKWQLMWETATITELKPDGQVAIQILNAPFKSVLPRDRIQLPHVEYENPEEIQRKLDLLSGTVTPVVRTWSDSTGQFKIEATLVSENGEFVKLKRVDGREVEVPIKKLSAEDQEFIKRPTKPMNPFEQ